MALITVSVTSTVIENMVTTDAAIQSALTTGNNITSVHDVAVLPISNTKSKAVMIWS